MKIEKTYPHNTEELKTRIDTFIESLKTLQLPAGVSVNNIQKSWHDNIMQFSFGACKGFIGTTFNGAIVVSAPSITLDVIIPGIVNAFVDESQLRKMIEEKMDDILN